MSQNSALKRLKQLRYWLNGNVNLKPKKNGKVPRKNGR